MIGHIGIGTSNPPAPLKDSNLAFGFNCCFTPQISTSTSNFMVYFTEVSTVLTNSMCRLRTQPFQRRAKLLPPNGLLQMSRAKTQRIL